MDDQIIIQDRMHRWLGGIRPAWDGIPPQILSSFIDVARIEDGPTIINENLTKEELSSSLVFHHAKLLLETINERDGTPLTQKGNLTRKFVDEILPMFNWPGQDEKTIRAVCKVINEQDILPLHFIHLLLRSANLLRKFKNKVIITNSGKEHLKEGSEGKLQSTLFKALVNNFNLAYLDRIPLEGIIQPQFGLILFLIGKVADDVWISPDKLMKFTVIPVEEMFSGHDDYPEMIFEARVIRFLKWFGLMEERSLVANDVYPRMVEVRKTDLFYRFVSCNKNPS